jgi:uncharacterized SAM-binding protein YcdF (DUF218 family)
MLLQLKYLKTVLRTLILPPSGPLLLALAGLLLLRWRPRAARLLLLLGFGSLWLLSVPAISDALTRLSERYPALDMSRAAQAQAVVILGGGGQRAYAPEYGGPAPDPGLLERLAYGAYIAHRTDLPILVSGYGVEAAAMRAALTRNFGLEARWMDEHAYDTFENARNSARLLRADDVHTIVLVTGASHEWRASHEFMAAGLEVIPAPTGLLAPREVGLMRYLPNSQALERSYVATYELFGEPVRQLLSWSHLRRQQ